MIDYFIAASIPIKSITQEIWPNNGKAEETKREKNHLPMVLARVSRRLQNQLRWRREEWVSWGSFITEEMSERCEKQVTTTFLTFESHHWSWPKKKISHHWPLCCVGPPENKRRWFWKWKLASSWFTIRTFRGLGLLLQSLYCFWVYDIPGVDPSLILMNES